MLDENLIGTDAIVVETFDDNNHVFKMVKKENKAYLQYETNLNYIIKLIIKPDLWVYFENGGYEQGVNLLKPLNPRDKKVLAKNFYIDPLIFNLLVNYKLISYSKAMADLYQLPIAYSCDIKYHTNDYKRKPIGTKEKVLEQLRLGKFH